MGTCALLPATAFHAEANLRALIESTEDLIWSVDLDYGLLTFNKALRDDIQQNFGVRAAVGMRPEDLMPPARAALWPPLYDRALSEGPFRVEYSLLDGRTLEMAFNRIVQDDETTGISVFGKDITERKTAEAGLREAEEKYRGTFEGAVEGLYRATFEGAILAANPALAQTLGYDSAQEIVSTITDSAHQVWLNPNERPQFLQMLEQHEAVRGYECQWKRKDGTAIWVSLNSRKVCGKDGRALYIEGFVEDITERKRAEDKLRESEAQLRQAQHLAHVGNSVWDVDSDTTTWSEEMYRITGRDPSGPAPRHAERAALYSPESWARLNEAVQRALATGEPYELDVDIVRPDGASRRTHASGAAVRDDRGRVVRLHGALQDITEQKRAEEALRQSEEALRQSNRKLQQLSRDLLRTQDYERRRIARELHDSTAQLLAALSINLGRLRDSELEAGRRKQVLSEAIDLAAACSAEIRTTTYLLHPPLLEEVGLADAVRTYVQGFNQRTGIQVKIKIPPDFGRLGNEMESTLFRIIQEGLANVHKHSGSRLAVLRLERDSREVRLVLQDEGRGFTEAPHRRAKGFVRLGVGITGMRERAEQLGGRLEVASGDAGTRLTVTLPMVQSNEETADIVGG